MQPLRRVIFATLPTMVALLGFMWFRRKKKVPELKDVERPVKGEKTVPSKKNNNVDGKDVTPQKEEAKKKNAVNYSMEDNIMISPVANCMAATPESQQKSDKAQQSRHGSSEPKSKCIVDKTSVKSDSKVSAHQPLSSSAPKCDTPPAPVLKEEKVCDSLHNTAVVKSSSSSSSPISQVNDNHSQKLVSSSLPKKHSETHVEPSIEVSQVKSSNKSLPSSTGANQKEALSNKEVEKGSNDKSAAVEPIKVAEAVVESVFKSEVVREVAKEVSSSNRHVERAPVEEEVVVEVAKTTESTPLECSNVIAKDTKPQSDSESSENVIDDLDAQIIVEESSVVPKEDVSEQLLNGSSHASVEEAEEVPAIVADVVKCGLNEPESPERVSAVERKTATSQESSRKERQEFDGEETTAESETSEGSSLENGKTHDSQMNGGDQLDHQNGLHSDSHSEVSSDSGKGNSVGETPQTTSPTVDVQEYTTYEFDFPSNLCGRLIGRMGKNINGIKEKTGADIFLKRKPYVRHFQICCIQGTHSQVNAALASIKKRFPPEYFEEITYEQLNGTVEAPLLTPDIMQLSLPEGVSVDVIVSSVVDVSHVFVQQPTHPTFTCLEQLNYCMNTCYGQDGIVPQLPRPIEVGVICAAPIYNGWYRAQVVVSHVDCDEYDIKFVDYGGYVRMQGCQLRQIRSDFTTLPFQAVECYVANIVPPEGQESFPPEASPVLENLVQGKILQAQIVAHEEDGVPYVQLYEVQGDQAVFVNREIVNQNVAQWMEFSS